MALPLTRSADFAIDKPAGTPCPNLTLAHRCRIHDRLRAEGFAGCAAYDCFGAGQRVTAADGDADAFRATTRLHELLWYLAEIAPRGADLAAEIDAAAADPATADLVALRTRVDTVLEAASGELRAGTVTLRRADLVGVDLRGHDLRDADLRGALLIAADLRGVGFGRADLIGADLRDARLDDADLSAALFLTQPQVGAARGNRTTRLPQRLARPAHWHR